VSGIVSRILQLSYLLLHFPSVVSEETGGIS